MFVSRAFSTIIQRRTYASFCCLGLKKSALVQNTLPTLQELPDVTRALKHPLEAEALESLHRAYDIFQNIRPGSPEAQAILALTADVQVMRGESPLKTLEQILMLQQPTNDNNHTSLIRLALAKAHWMQGDFFTAAALCQQVLEDDASLATAARNGYALCQLLNASTMDDLFIVRDPFRRNAMHHSRLGVAQLNFGAAEVLYGDLLKTHRPDVTEVPLDPALRQWKQALTWFKRHNNNNNNQVKGNSMAVIVQSQLNASMAWGLLQLQEIEQASKYAHESLKLLEHQQQQQQQQPLTLPLTLLAQCYHKSGAAVTAEGLLQTATSTTPRTLTEKLQLRYALRAYAALCEDWDKRGGDAERLLAQADQIIDLPGQWKNNKDSFVYTSLWFWLPFDL